jgi:programmed cell death protein 5
MDPSPIDPEQIPEGFSTSDPNGASNASQNQAESQQVELHKQAILEQALMPDALERLRRIKLVKLEKATAVENAIVRQAMQGRLTGRINEGKLIEMLEGSHAQHLEKTSQRISIQRKKYALDSDEEDDNDDDL